MLRLGELETETAAAVAELNALVAGEIAALNEMLGPSPRIMVGRPDQ
jgi:glycine cleavage system H lipoate-binding protein